MDDSACFVTNPATNTPQAPSLDEQELYYYGIPSKPRLIARSSSHTWKLPTGPEAYLVAKECSPVGSHRLTEVWEDTIIPTMQASLLKGDVQYTSLDPVCIGTASESLPPVIIWMGVVPGSLSAEQGIKAAIHCQSILTNHGTNDVHVEICESLVTPSAKMYKPVISAHPLVEAIEPFSTLLGISICSAATPSIEGTGGLFFTDPKHPGKLYLLTARHVLIQPGTERNEPYEYHEGLGQPLKKVLLLGEVAFKACLTALEFEIQCKQANLDHLNARLEHAAQMEDRKDTEMEEEEVRPLLAKLENTTKSARRSRTLVDFVEKAIEELGKFLIDVTREWKDPEKRIIGHILLSPPISFNFGSNGFTEDWAVVEIYPSMINISNFVGNVIDLGTSTAVGELTTQMYPCVSNPTSFKYPENRLLKFHGTISDEQMYKPDPRTQDQDSDPVIMVLKRGNASKLTVGRLNNIRSVTRVYVEGKLSGESREVAVLPRTSKSGAFSEPGDSGSVVISGTGQVAGIITGGAGNTENFDCTYLTSINFILNRLIEHKIHADIFPISVSS